MADAHYACTKYGSPKVNIIYTSSEAGTDCSSITDCSTEADSNDCGSKANTINSSSNNCSTNADADADEGDSSTKSDACYLGLNSCSDLSKPKLGVYGCVNSIHGICDGCDCIKHVVVLCRRLRSSCHRSGSDRFSKQSRSLRTWPAKPQFR